MAILEDHYSDINNSTKIILEINLVKNNWFHFCNEREDYLNWIPFEFCLKIGEEESYSFLKDDGATLCLLELKNFLKGIENILSVIEIRDLKDKRYLEETNIFKFYAMESYFGIIFEDSYDDLISTTLWVNISCLNNRSDHGYSRGFEFIVSLQNLIRFKKELQEQLDILIKE